MKETFWMKTRKQKDHYPALTKETDTHIAIIGGGLTGIHTAYYLSQTNEDALLLEADTLCFGASGRNTGKLSAQHGLLYKTLIEQYDKVFARQYYDANMEALHTIQSLVEKYQMDCGLSFCDALLYTNDATRVADLQDEYQAYLDLKIPCTWLDAQDTPIPMKAGLKMPYQARFNPYAYGLGLAKAAHEEGIDIYEHSPIHDMKEEEHGYALYVNDTIVHADIVIFATQFPFIDRGQFYFTRMYEEKEHVLCADVKEALPQAMMLSMDEEVHSFNAFEQQLVYAGSCDKCGQEDIPHNQDFENSLHTFYSVNTIQAHWTSQDYMSFDHLPLIGKLEKHEDRILFASGFNKWGNTTSCIAGKLLCAYALHRGSPYRMLFSPQRLSNIFSLAFVKENANVVHAFIKSKLQRTSKDYPKLEEGVIMELDEHRYGVYRDKNEELYIVDILCPHMGCTLHFNHDDKTWDCPCHGSRFSYTGDIIKGPASSCLHRFQEGHNPVDPHILK